MNNLGMFRLRALLILLVAFSSLGMAKKPPPLTVRFHSETNPNDTSTFGMQVQLTNPPRQAFVSKVPEFSEEDIEAVFPFPAADGTLGCAFQLDAHGKLALETMSRDKTGKVLVVVVNGRQVVNMVIDRPVTDGVVTIQSGLTPAEIALLQKKFRTLGQSGKKR